MAGARLRTLDARRDGARARTPGRRVGADVRPRPHLRRRRPRRLPRADGGLDGRARARVGRSCSRLGRTGARGRRRRVVPRGRADGCRGFGWRARKALRVGRGAGRPAGEPLHGITAPKVYPLYTSLYKAVSSYLTFSPSWSRLRRDHSYFLWHYLLSRLVRDSRLFTGGLPYAVRTFLPDTSER